VDVHCEGGNDDHDWMGWGEPMAALCALDNVV